jgi:vancomycin resistance protein YoaR
VITENTKTPINATLATQGGKVVTTEAVSGTQIDWEKTKKSLRESWLYEGRKAEVVIAYIPPAVSNEDVNKVRSNLADLAVASPITLKIGTRSIEISPEVIGTALNFVPNKEKLESKFDETVIVNEISRQIPNIQTTASDAKFDFIGDRVFVIPAQEGIKFKPGQLDAALSPAFRQKDNRVVNLDSAVVKPLITTESLDALGIKEQLSTFRQDFDYLPYRETNVGQAARYMDGKILKPGEIFSMNETIKERTAKNGYVKGIYIGEGGRFDFGLGGGVSIITSATWTAAFYAGLERIEQRAHSVLIARYTPGLEATVSWPKLDLKFRNNTNNSVLIKAIPARDGITISMYGTKEYDRITAKFGEPYNLNNNIDVVNSYDPNCLPQDPAPGFKIVVTRQFWKNNSIVQSENLTTSYRPSDNIICLKEGEVAPSANPSVVPAASGVPQPVPQS